MSSYITSDFLRIQRIIGYGIDINHLLNFMTCDCYSSLLKKGVIYREGNKVYISENTI